MSDDAPMVVAIYDYQAKDETELTIKKNEKLYIIDDSQTWWKVQNDRNVEGLVPSNYVKRKEATKDKKKIIDNLKSKVGFNKSSKNRHSSSDESDQQCNKAISKSGMKVVAVCTTKFNYHASRDDELELRKGDQILVLEKENDGWWKGEANGKIGWFPYNYVDLSDIDPSSIPSEYATPSELASTPISRPVLMRVRTLYQFKSQSDEELTFDKDATLEIIDKPRHDPDWWLARKQDGKEGLVPRNYVIEIDESHSDKQIITGPIISPSQQDTTQAYTFINEDWFHGAISRQDSERMLHKYASDGEFLVRESESKAGDFSLSMKAPDRIKHFRIKMEKDTFVIGQRSFSSMEDLVVHYKTSPIFTTDNGTKMYLVKAFSKAVSTRNGFGTA